MQKFISVKLTQGKPMTRGEYNTAVCGWTTPAAENPADEGYLVEYLDSPTKVHENHANYISWCPKDVFERANRLTDGMTFGLAIEAMKKGLKVQRAGWNGKNMYLCLLRGSNTDDGKNTTSGDYSVNRSVVDRAWGLLPWLGMKTVQGDFVPWLASQTDVLSDDWKIVE